jgi:hypothetical protein
MDDQHPPMFFDDDFMERRNMAWRVEPGRLDPHNPLLVGDLDWDGSTPIYSGTVLKDPLDGVWKMWGAAYPVFDSHKWGEWDCRLAYAVSEDGVHWTKPQLDGFPCMGRETTNVLLDFADGGNCFQASVLIDPAAEPDRRYEMFLLQDPRYKNPSGLVKGLAPPTGGAVSHPWGVYRYLSADGLRWRAIEGPLEIESADSIYVYRDLGSPYVSFHKFEPETPPGSALVPHDVGLGALRTIVRRDSDDGSNWSDPPLPVMAPDWRDAHDTQFMDLGPLRQGNGYVATVTVFHALNQTIDVQFAGSCDARTWFRPIPRTPCVSNGPVGDVGGGHIFQSHRLIEDGDELHLYYFGIEGLHGDLYTEISRQREGHGQEAAHPTGGLCRASWKRGRLWSVVPSASGPSEAIATRRITAEQAGRRLVINAVTHDDGIVEAELTDSAGIPLPGYRRDESRKFQGDDLARSVAWKGGDRCPSSAQRVRFFIRKARLHGAEWR